MKNLNKNSTNCENFKDNAKQIVIESLDEIDKYREQLKKISVWVCNTACGKSYLCAIDNRFYDLDAYRSFLSENNVENYEDATIPKMNEILASGRIVLNAAHGHFLNYLEKNNIPFVYMYCKPEAEDEYIERMRHRGSSEEFVQRFGIHIADHYSNRAKDKRGLFKIEMNPKEYASDYIWKVFGKAKKYIQNYNFNKNQYKIVFSDLDNTLTNINTEITPFTKKTIAKIKQKVPFVLASARMSFSLKPFLEDIFLDNKKHCNENYFSICCNGALIKQNDEKIIYKKSIKKENIILFFDIFNEKIAKKCKFFAEDKTFYMSEIKDINQFNKQNEIFKIEIFDSASSLEQIKNSLPEKLLQNFEIAYSCESILTLLEKGVTKRNAVKFLLKELNIQKTEAIAFGDNENDLDMIKYVHCGVAVCNATAEVKKSAKFITDSNNDDGVAKALIKIFDL